MISWASLFHKMFTVGVSIGAAVSSVVPVHHHHSTPVTHHTVVQPTVAQRVITINKTVDAMGKEVAIHLQMPENGGVITGMISGDCQGTIDGTYSGPSQYTLQGKGDVTCTIGFLSLPATVGFNGIVQPANQTATIHYTITSGSNFSKAGDVTVSYTE